MNIYHYVIDQNGNPRIATMDEWVDMFGDRGRIVKQENVGDMFISTVFLGLDHNFSWKGPPVLWETMVFGPNPDKDDKRFHQTEVDGYTERCSGNREQAEAMHERVVAMVKSNKVK